MNTFRLNDGTVLMKGKRYLWSGTIEKLYIDVIWKDNLCKITNIDTKLKQVSVYEPFERKEYRYSYESINKFSFKPWWRFLI